MASHVSFRDLRRIPELSKYSELEMLSPSLDELIAHWVSLFGVDVEFGLAYEPNIHRDLFNQVALGFIARGDVSINRLDINGPFSDLTDRLVAACYTDRSLLDELSTLAKVRDFNEEWEQESEDILTFPAEMLEPDYEDMERMIAELCIVRDKIRAAKE